MGEVLKVNSTLGYLYLNVSVFHIKIEIKKQLEKHNGNQIGDSGAISIGESLKVNSILTSLKLQFMNR